MIIRQNVKSTLIATRISINAAGVWLPGLARCIHGDILEIVSAIGIMFVCVRVCVCVCVCAI